MNNKKLGTEFEKQMCRYLAKAGYWVHFIQPDSRGAQPFDIIAVKNNEAYAIDCKTNSEPIFRMDRLEDNQVLAFARWEMCGNNVPLIAVRCDFEKPSRIKLLSYCFYDGRIDLRKYKQEDYYISIMEKIINEYHGQEQNNN